MRLESNLTDAITTGSPDISARNNGFALDITDHKKLTEEALRRSQAFNLFMQHLLSWLLKILRDVALPQRCLSCQALSSGFKRAGRSNLKNFGALSLSLQFNEQDRVVLASRQPLTIEESYPDREGLKCWLACKFPIFQRDQLTLIGRISVDITARKRAEGRF